MIWPWFDLDLTLKFMVKVTSRRPLETLQLLSEKFFSRDLIFRDIHGNFLEWDTYLKNNFFFYKVCATALAYQYFCRTNYFYFIKYNYQPLGFFVALLVMNIVIPVELTYLNCGTGTTYWEICGTLIHILLKCIF